jgi:extradiol dioxygenase
MDIKALGYLGFESPEAKAWEKFGPEIFGLGLSEPGNDGTAYLRMDDRHHRIAIHPGEADRLAYIGWELRGSAAFAAAVEELRGKKLDVTLGSPAECAERRVQGLARIHDPAGYVHEVFCGPTLIANSFLPGKPMGGFVADGYGVGHVVVVVPELTRELDDFATGVLGFELFSGRQQTWANTAGQSRNSTAATAAPTASLTLASPACAACSISASRQTGWMMWAAPTIWCRSATCR